MAKQSFSGTAFSGVYLGVQAAGIVGWWVWMVLDPPSRPMFLGQGAGVERLISYLLLDLLVVLASVLAGHSFFRSLPGFGRWSAVAAVAMMVAAALCLVFALRDDSGWMGVAVMGPAAWLTAIAAFDGRAGEIAIFRRARSAATRRHVAVTALQTSVFWVVFLFLIPPLLAWLQGALGSPLSSGSTATRGVAALLFALCGAVGLWSGYTMASVGRGTPLPLDAPNRLVVAGPYAFVRNPMVLAGLGQGVAVALWLGSWLVLVYVMAGGVLWQLLVRPAEEADLVATFGDAFVRYCAAVRCWWPRLRRARSPRDLRP